MRTSKMKISLALVSCILLVCVVNAEDAVVEEVTDSSSEKVLSLVEKLKYVSPKPDGDVYLAEYFDDPEAIGTKWVKSQAKKEGTDESLAKYDGQWAIEPASKEPIPGDLGLVMKSKAKHAAISCLLEKPFHFTDKPMIVQYDVTLQNGQECGGAYLKLLQYDKEMRLSQFTDKTPYTILFGPDKCGNDNKLHFIFQHKNPKNESFEEKHAKKPSTKLDEYFSDKKPHLYRLQVYPDNTFDVSVDYKIINKGSLLEDMVPPVNPLSEIDDPEDRMHSDWDKREKIPDPAAVKPEDWDEDAPEQVIDEKAVKPSGWLEDEEIMIPDPTAVMPDDWDEEMDGIWEAPLIENPACESAPGCGKWTPSMMPNPEFKGKWRAPLIDNPNYRGKWRPKKIPNPDYYFDPNPFHMSSIGAVGIEVWSMSDNILFDNVIVTDDKDVADQWAAATFDIKRELVDSEGVASAVEIVKYVSPDGDVYLAEHFDNPEAIGTKWVKSQAKKEGTDESLAKYDGLWAIEPASKEPIPGDLGLVMKSKAKHAAISALLEKPFHFTDKPLIVQYDVTLQNGQECGGAYLKLLQYDKEMRLSQFTDKTPYTIMFGPDKCGNDHKLHFIFQHKNPKNESFEEKHAKKPSTKLDEYFSDKKPHLYRLQVYPDNTFDVSVDYKIINKGSLLEDMVPPVNPPSEIDDPEDRMPSDWDEREKIPDPAAVKPEDWDEDAPEQVIDENAVKPSGWLEDEEIMIPDPTAVMPDDWDEEMDGTWEAPLIENPACESAPGCGKWTPPMMPNPEFKGKWRAPLIDNPNYRGKWRPKKIPNPDYYFDPNPFHMSSIGAVGIEVWSMSDNILFDNVIVTDDKDVADQWAAATFDIKRELVDSDGDSFVQWLVKYTNKNPWLWAVYVVAIALPVVLILSFCFGGKEKKAQAAAAAAKKSDALTPDDEAIEAEADVEGSGEEEQEEMEAEEEETAPLIEEKVVADADKSSSPRRRKSRKE